MTSSLRIIVTGLIAQHPLLGGVTWDYLQYVLGLVRLGHDAYYIEDTGEWPYDRRGGSTGSDYEVEDCSPNEEYRAVHRLAYIDSDPVFTQVKLARGQANFRKQVDAHDVHFSFGEWLTEAVPATGHEWRPTRQPIVLSEWRRSDLTREVFTTVMNWTSYNPILHDGQRYGQKDLEFEQFLDLPARVTPTVLEIAIRGTKRRRIPESLLTYKGWRVVDPLAACPDLDSYRDYIACSKAEWSVAKNACVIGRAGWFSCRSACYLATGRPVVVQDTGFSPVLPTGEGILPFETMDEAVEAIRAVEGDYERHAKAARAIAETYFASDKVLGRLVDEAMDGPSSGIPRAPRA